MVCGCVVKESSLVEGDGWHLSSLFPITSQKNRGLSVYRPALPFPVMFIYDVERVQYFYYDAKTGVFWHMIFCFVAIIEKVPGGVCSGEDEEVAA